MRKQGVILIIATIMAMVLCGAASAADSSTAGGEALSKVTSLDSSENVDPIIWVKVNYTYADDKINPGITVKDSSNTKIAVLKNVYQENYYKVNFTYNGVVTGDKFKVTLTAPGYKTQTKEVTVSQSGSDPEFVGIVEFKMQATANYKLGRKVTDIANQKLNFNTADKVLAITTAGVPKLNGVTSEDCIEGILNASKGKITYGKGNLLMLRQTAVDPVDFAFIVKRGTSLQTICFRNGSATLVYQGTISQNMKAKDWNKLIAKVGGENAFAYASLANGWNAGAPSDVLREAAFHGHVCLGSLGGYSITQALMKYYPPIQATLTGSGSPGDVTSYKVLGSPGDSDDDALMYFLDTTPGKGSGYTGFDTNTTGAKSNMVGFIRWNDNTKLGDIIILRFKKDELRKEFQKISGLKLDNDLAELKFNSWLISYLKTNPGKLVEFVEQKIGLNEVQYYYIMGNATDIKNSDGTVRIPAQKSHGLDLAYIRSLGLANATPDSKTSVNSQLTYEQMKQIGVDAAKLAKQIFHNDLGIDLESFDRDLAIETSAGYVYLNGQTTEATWDGIYQELGARLTRSTLLPIHTGVWKPLIYTFILRGEDGTTMNTIYMRYNETTGQWIVKTGSDGKRINDMGPVAINNAANVTNLDKNVFENGNFFNYRTIANAWRNDPPFDQLMTFLFHDHACPGVQPGFFISDYVLKNLPLGKNESYFYMGSTIYCKDDAMIYLLGISPGMGTYMNQKLLTEETISELLPEIKNPDGTTFVGAGSEEGLFVVWDNKLNIGRAYIINYQGPKIDLTGLNTPEAKAEAQIAAYVHLYNNIPDARVKSKPQVKTTDKKLITAEELKMIKQGVTSTTSALQYYKDLPTRLLSDLIPADNTDDGDSGTNTGRTNTDGINSNGINGLPSGSVGLTAAALTAAAATSTAGDQAGETRTAHEINEVPVGTEKTDSPWGAYAAVGILSILALVGFGFFFKDSIFGR